MKHQLASFLFAFMSLPLAAQETADTAFLSQLDSLIAEAEREQMVRAQIDKYNKLALKKELQFNTDGFVPLLRGVILSNTEHDFIRHPGTLPQMSDSYRWSDYAVAGAPLAATWVLKASGVKSRSKFQRMLSANAMSLALAMGTAEVVKHAVTEVRPDGADDHSFPSGHATIAFASATILAREYGYLSPWVTVGAYSAATGAQLLRIKHNKHWVNDLYFGAGIGMVSTSLGYYLTDLIFKEDGVLTRPELRRRDFMRVKRFNNKPSGFSFVTGTEAGSRHYHIGDAMMKTSASISTGVDLSWFLTPNFAIEAVTRATSGQAKVFANDTYTGANFQLYHFNVAAKASVPFALGQRLGVRALAGGRQFDALRFESTATSAEIHIPSEFKFECGCGINYLAIDKDNFAGGFVLDYYHTFSNVMADRLNVGTSWKVIF